MNGTAFPARGRAASIAGLGAAIDDALRPFLPAGGSYALIDFPDHSNVGDSAIWIGEIECLERLTGAAPRYVADRQHCDWKELQRAVPAGPVFLSGGGNLGDLWPEQQRFREEALERLRGRLVIQLPQSIHFNDAAALRRAASAIDRHGNFVLLTRDAQSCAIAKAAFSCRVVLVPDMATALGARQRLGLQRHDLLMVLREDRERAERRPGASSPLPSASLVKDWVPAKEPGLRQVLWMRTVLETGFPASPDAQNARRERYYRKLAQARLTRGIKLLSSAKFVISDRLHVHILCTLLGIPHAILDQSYGKTSAFVASWTGGFAPIEICSDLDGALQSRRRRVA